MTLSMYINSFIVEKSLTYFNFLLLFNFSYVIFSLGFIGSFYNKRNLLILLLCIELMLISIGLNFIFMSLIINKSAQIFSLFIITVAAVESSIGLGLLIVVYRSKKTIDFERFSSLKF